MLCPECGEVVGNGPLDRRHACHGEKASVQPPSPIGRLWRRLAAGMRRLLRGGSADKQSR